MAFKLVISDPKTRKSYQKEFAETGLLVGKKIGETISGSTLGLGGYELEITGGSDRIGNPMREDVEGSVSRRLLLTNGVGFHGEKGKRKKKRVRGNTISEEVVQVNLKVTKQGTKPLEQIFPVKPKEEKKEKPKVEEKKPEPKKEERKEKAPAPQKEEKEEKPPVAKPEAAPKPEEKK